jgi:hypothetical protein
MVGAMSVFGAGAAHAGAEVSHFKSNGANASHNSFNGTTAFDLNVTRNDSASGTTTFFAFFTQTCNADFSVCTGTFGNGFIPNADFTVGGANANLNTNLATNSGFQVFNYVQDATGFNTTPGIGGIVTISWKQIPRQSTSMKGTQTTVFGGFSVKFTGEQSSNSANTTGTLNGVALPTTSSSLIGTSKSSEVIINRN